MPTSRHARAPITALAKNYPNGSHVGRHSHLRGQLVYAASGIMRVMSAEGSWIVPPQRAVWVPARLVHEITMHGEVAMRTLYLDPKISRDLGLTCRVLFVSRLLRELVLEIVQTNAAEPDVQRKRLIAGLLLNELRRARRAPLYVPTPSDPRLKRVCERLLDDLSGDETLEQLAHRTGASSRTLARLFRREVGMTFVQWQQHARLAHALSQISVGTPIKEAAYEAGYDSPSAFTAMFHRLLGVPPTQYLKSSSV